MRLRFGLGIALLLTSAALAADDLWRLLASQNCAQHSRLCVAASSNAMELTAQIYFALLGIVVAIALIIEALTGRRHDGRLWGGLTLVPAALSS